MAHCRTRNTVERMFGVWKRRFACLATGLRLKKDTVLVVIVATAVLHNIARDLQGDNELYAELEFDDQQDQNVMNMQIPNNRLCVVVRNSIIQRHFD